jgi:membrane fusion protein
MSTATPLFRHEAVEAKRPQVLGEIVLLPGSGSRWVAWLALALVAALVLLFAFGTYTRRSTVTGQLIPVQGLLRITVEQPGVVVETNVREGQAVSEGQLLLVVSGDRMGIDAAGYQRDMAAQIDARRRSLAADLARLDRDESSEVGQWRRRVASLADERARALRQAEQLAVQVQVAESTVERYRGLFAKGFVSRDELSDKESALAGARAGREGALRQSMALEREATAAQRELDAMKSRNAMQRGELERQRLLAAQEFTALEAKRRVLVTAPQAGRITLLRAEPGQSVEPQRPLVHIVPEGNRLVARLQVPSRAAGFVRPGTPVRLRYDAFPYQKFGQQEARVQSVSAAAAWPVESNASTGAGVASSAPEPSYEVTVELPAQILHNDSALQLQAGMRVEADLLHETRTLLEWMFEPLFAARERSANTPPSKG